MFFKYVLLKTLFYYNEIYIHMVRPYIFSKGFLQNNSFSILLENHIFVLTFLYTSPGNAVYFLKLENLDDYKNSR